MSRFEFDEHGFDRAMRQWSNEAVRRIAADAQPRLDVVHRDYAGKPVDEVARPCGRPWPGRA